MDKKLKLELSAQAIRFANNILCEVSNNFASSFSKDARDALRTVLTNLSTIEFEIRSELMGQK